MRGRTVLVLLVVVVALVIFIGFYERDLPSSEEREASASRVLGIDADAVRAVTIETETTTVRLEKIDETGWRLLEPVSARADGEAVDQMLAALVELDKQRSLTDIDASEVGLDPPRLRVVVQLEDSSRGLDLGSAVPGSDSLVVAIADDPSVYVVADSILTELEKEPDQWRDRVLFNGNREQLERLVLNVGGERRSMLRRGTEFWLEAPLADRADEDRVNDLLRELEALRVGTFIDPAVLGESEDVTLAEIGLADPEWVLEAFTSGEPMPFRLEVGVLVGDSASRRYGRVGELLFEADSELFVTIARPVADWLSPRWTTLRPYQVDRITFSGGPPAPSAAAIELELTRADGDWLRAGERIEAATVNDLLYAATGAEAEEVVTAAAAAADLAAHLEEVRWTLILASDDGTEEVLTAYAPLADGRSPVRVSARDSVLLLPPAEVAEVDRLLAVIESTEPLPKPADGLPVGDS